MENSTMITIYDDSAGLRLMDVISPFIVEPGQEFEIRVISQSDGVPDVIIEVYYEGEKQEEYVTGADGRITVLAPTVNENNYFSVLFGNEEYDTYSGENEFLITLFEQTFLSDLQIKLTPSEVYEGEEVTVEVTDEIEVGVSEASIWRGSTGFEEGTDTEGILVILAPQVFMDREYYIYAIKEGYNFAEKTLTVRNKAVEQDRLQISVDDVINESEVFQVTITDDDNTALNEVIVSFNDDYQLSSEAGVVAFSAPEVSSNTIYSIEANKYGFYPTSVSLEIRDTESIDGSSSTQLMVYVVERILENEGFTITVKDEQGQGVDNARVEFLDTFYYTDFKGTVSVTSPDVAWDETREIIVTKSGYESNTAEIVIIDSEEFPIWYLLIGAILGVILVIGLVAYYRYGSLL
jgi:hypothetical protein